MSPLQQSLVVQVGELAKPIVESKDAFIVEVQIRGERGGKAIEVFIDGDTAITTGLCAQISRELSQTLDVGNLIKGRYHLIVSSPGVDRPLKFPRQYGKHIGRKVIVLSSENGLKEKIEGMLLSVTAEGIELQVSDSKTEKVLFAEILEARVQPGW